MDSCSIDFEQLHATCSTEESIRRITIAQTAPLNAIFTITTKNTILQDKLPLFVEGLLWEMTFERVQLMAVFGPFFDIHEPSDSGWTLFEGASVILFKKLGAIM